MSLRFTALSCDEKGRASSFPSLPPRSTRFVLLFVWFLSLSAWTRREISKWNSNININGCAKNNDDDDDDVSSCDENKNKRDGAVISHERCVDGFGSFLDYDFRSSSSSSSSNHNNNNNNQCTCERGYGGARCRDAVCEDKTCAPHGVCQYGYCLCEDGWKGAECDVPVCNEEHAKCNAEHGKCANPDFCACDEGY